MSLHAARLKKMKAKKYSITQEESRALIDAVKRRPWLYDFDSYAFKRESVKARQRGWQAVVDDLHNRGMEEAFQDHMEVRMRWKNIKDMFRRHVKAIYLSKLADEDVSKPVWPYFSDIMFLLPHCINGLYGLDQKWFTELTAVLDQPPRESPVQADCLSNSMVTVQPVSEKEESPSNAEMRDDIGQSPTPADLPRVASSRSLKRSQISMRRKRQPLFKQPRLQPRSEDNYENVVTAFNFLERRFDTFVKKAEPLIQLAGGKTEDEIDVFVKLLAMQMKCVEDGKVLNQLQLDILGSVNKAKHESIRNLLVLKSQQEKQHIQQYPMATLQHVRTPSLNSIPQYIILPPNATLAPTPPATAGSLKLPIDKPRTIRSPSVNKPATMTKLRSAVLYPSASPSATTNIESTMNSVLNEAEKVNPRIMIARLNMDDMPEQRVENGDAKVEETGSMRDVLVEARSDEGQSADGHDVAVQLMNDVIVKNHLDS